MPCAFGRYLNSSLSFLSTSKASGADAHMMSGGLDRVSRMKVTAALVLRFCISTLVPGYFFWNACAKGSVTSLENDVTMTSRFSIACANAEVAASESAAASRNGREANHMALLRGCDPLASVDDTRMKGASGVGP